MSILAVLIVPRGSWRSWTVRPTRLTASRQLDAVERLRRGELDVAGAGRARLHAPAGAGAPLHHALGVGHALGAAFLALDADQGGAGVAELLQRDLADAEPAQRRAQLVELDRALLGAHLDGDAALEVDAEIEAEDEDADQRQHVDHRRQDRARSCACRGSRSSSWARMRWSGLHNMTAPQIGSSVGRRQRTQTASSMRVKMVAREQMGQQAERQRGGEAADRAGAEAEQQDAGDQRRQVGIDDRRQRALVAGGERAEGRAAVAPSPRARARRSARWNRPTCRRSAPGRRCRAG